MVSVDNHSLVEVYAIHNFGTQINFVLHLCLVSVSSLPAVTGNTHLKPYLVQAARETGALKEAKDKLEKHVEELTWRLQLEKRLRVS